MSTYTIDDLFRVSAVRIDGAPQWWRVVRWSRDEGVSLVPLSGGSGEELENIAPARVTETYKEQFHDVIVNTPSDWGNMVAGDEAARAIGKEICGWFGKDPDKSVSAPGYDPLWSYIAGSYGKAIERALSKAGFVIVKRP